jgi:hypothetical protein
MSTNYSSLSRRVAGVSGMALVALFAGCADEPGPAAPSIEPAYVAGAGGSVTPTPLVTVTAGPRSVQFWPFTGTDVAGAASDPVNLLFPGQGDARVIRDVLIALSGDRTAFGMPDVEPFNCTWADAIGANQTAWTADAGWVGSAIQLECGEYGPMRFHIRLFPAGDWTLANAHFEVLIPGTQAHEVLSWERAETLVMIDFIRSGMLTAPPSQTIDQINPSPYRGINPLVYNGLPLALRGALGLPLADQVAPVPIPNDGFATILHTAAPDSRQPMVLLNDYVLQFDQVIPKPFCAAGPFDYLYVNGPIRFSQRVIVSGSGNYISQFHGQGRLELTPVNPLTSPPTPIGATFHALVNEHYRNIVTDRTTMVSNLQFQIMLPPTAPFRGRLNVSLSVGPAGASYTLDITCS